jgi:hypothetical protein
MTVVHGGRMRWLENVALPKKGAIVGAGRPSVGDGRWGKGTMANQAYMQWLLYIVVTVHVQLNLQALVHKAAVPTRVAQAAGRNTHLTNRRFLFRPSMAILSVQQYNYSTGMRELHGYPPPYILQ